MTLGKNFFDYNQFSKIYLRDIALTAIMLHPNSEQLRRHYEFKATVQVYGAFMRRSAPEFEGKQEYYHQLANKEFLQLLPSWGGWAEIAESLNQKDSYGFKESMHAQLIKGHIAGDILGLALTYKTSLSHAAELYCEAHQEGNEFLDVIKEMKWPHNFEPTEINLINNIWKEFKEVAHLHIALSVFGGLKGIPEVSTHISFDAHTNNANTPEELIEGFDGFCAAAEAYRKLGTTFKAPRANRPVLSPDAWQLALPPGALEYNISIQCA